MGLGPCVYFLLFGTGPGCRVPGGARHSLTCNYYTGGVQIGEVARRFKLLGIKGLGIFSESEPT